MPSRRTLLQAVLSSAFLAALAPLASGQQSSPSTGDVSLKDTLLFGLRPRTPAEKAFINTVVAKVTVGALPLELVIATFRWARPKQPYPFPFFERAMRQRAAKVGVIL